MDRYRARALQVASFCRGQWGWEYCERTGSVRFIRRLLEFSHTGVTDSEDIAEEFVIVKPGGEARQESFMLTPITLREE
jgi:hypothetical protein